MIPQLSDYDSWKLSAPDYGDPGFFCDHKGCEHAEYDRQDLLRCDGDCGKRYCAEHLTDVGDGLRVCEACQ